MLEEPSDSESPIGQSISGSHRRGEFFVEERTLLPSARLEPFQGDYQLDEIISTSEIKEDASHRREDNPGELFIEERTILPFNGLDQLQEDENVDPREIEEDQADQEIQEEAELFHLKKNVLSPLDYVISTFRSLQLDSASEHVDEVSTMLIKPSDLKPSIGQGISTCHRRVDHPGELYIEEHTILPPNGLDQLQEDEIADPREIQETHVEHAELIDSKEDVLSPPDNVISKQVQSDRSLVGDIDNICRAIDKLFLPSIDIQSIVPLPGSVPTAEKSDMAHFEPKAETTIELIAAPKPEEQLELPKLVHENKYLYCGLKNPGLICYSNSVLQVLYTAREIRKCIKRHTMRGPFNGALASLFRKMEMASRKEDMATRPYDFNHQFREVKPQFTVYEMHDAQEYMTILLELLHEEMNRATKIKPDKDAVVQQEEPQTAQQAWDYHAKHIDNSSLSHLLMGQLENSVTCLTCHNRSLSWSAVWQLQLDVPESDKENDDLTLNECIEHFTADEVLKDDCAPHCSKCESRQAASKKQTICRPFHRYLMVHLKRFAPTGRKIHRPVVISEQLVLGGKQYDLQSAIIHKGSEGIGHYATLFREADDHWVMLDDQRVNCAISSNVALQMLKLFTYMCIYKRV